jgi:O-antigen/teichoic acid export membrane protein
VYLTRSVAWGVLGLGLAWALVLLGYDIRNSALALSQASPRALAGPTLGKVRQAYKVRPHWAIRTLGRLTWLALPLGLVMTLVNLNLNIPRYFVERYLGERELGIFAAMAYIMVAGVMVVTALGQAATPRLSKYYAEQNGAEFGALLLRLVGIGALLGIVGTLVSSVAGQEILTFLYGPEYAKYPDVFLLLMGAAGVYYVASFLGYGMTAARYFRAQAPLFTFIVCVSVIACLWLVPAAGLKGAAAALLIAAAVQLCGSLAIVMYALYVLPTKRRKERKT